MTSITATICTEYAVDYRAGIAHVSTDRAEAEEAVQHYIDAVLVSRIVIASEWDIVDATEEAAALRSAPLANETRRCTAQLTIDQPDSPYHGATVTCDSEHRHALSAEGRRMHDGPIPGYGSTDHPIHYSWTGPASNDDPARCTAIVNGTRCCLGTGHTDDHNDLPF